MWMCPEEDYSTVVETLAFDEKIWVQIEETEDHEYQPNRENS